jgi:hypothetical protein
LMIDDVFPVDSAASNFTFFRTSSLTVCAIRSSCLWWCSLPCLCLLVSQMLMFDLDVNVISFDFYFVCKLWKLCLVLLLLSYVIICNHYYHYYHC